MSIEDSVNDILESRRAEEQKMRVEIQNRSKEYAERFFKRIHDHIVEEVIKTGNYSVSGSFIILIPDGKDYNELQDDVISCIFDIKTPKSFSWLDHKDTETELMISKSYGFDTFFLCFNKLTKAENISVKWIFEEVHHFFTNNYTPGTINRKTHNIDISTFSSILLPFKPRGQSTITINIIIEYSYKK